jgi:hypothetical protein
MPMFEHGQGRPHLGYQLPQPPTPSATPPNHVVHRLAYKTCDERPGEVYSIRHCKWVPATDVVYTSWKTKSWAQEQNFATINELQDYLDRDHDRGRHSIALRRLFRARELFAVLTDEDVANIQIALDAETGQAKSDKAAGHAPRTPLRLLWASLQAQGDAPIDVTDVRFQAGWAGIRQALTAARAAAIATALNIREPA